MIDITKSNFKIKLDTYKDLFDEIQSTYKYFHTENLDTSNCVFYRYKYILIHGNKLFKRPDSNFKINNVIKIKSNKKLYHEIEKYICMIDTLDHKKKYILFFTFGKCESFNTFFHVYNDVFINKDSKFILQEVLLVENYSWFNSFLNNIHSIFSNIKKPYKFLASVDNENYIILKNGWELLFEDNIHPKIFKFSNLFNKKFKGNLPFRLKKDVFVIFEKTKYNLFMLWNKGKVLI